MPGDPSADRTPGDRDLARQLASVRASHTALVAWLRSLGAVDAASPSRLPGWTVGQLLVHLVDDAEQRLALLVGDESVVETAPHRSWRDLLDRVAASCRALDTGWENHVNWTEVQRLAPLARQREVEIHRVDLGLGYELSDLPADYVRRDLRLAEMAWQARRPMGLTPLPPAARSTDPATRLGWLLGRAEIEGLGPPDS